MTNATLVADWGHQQDLLGQTVVLIGGSSGIRSLTAASLQIVVCHVAKDLQRTVWSWRQRGLRASAINHGNADVTQAQAKPLPASD